MTGIELKVKRILKKIKETEIAKQLGVSQSYISLMESGKRKIPEHIYKRWIGLLK